MRAKQQDGGTREKCIRLGGTDPHILLENIHTNGSGEYVIFLTQHTN
jgi:hypothetical protein